MTVKSLKKQLAAAIAMVIVAAVALSSSTYAWFVTNNEVKATTSTISAQSNAAFMTITYNATAVGVDTTEDVATLTSTPLYPATYGETSTVKGKFQTGNGTGVDDGTLKGALTVIGTAGTPDDAVTAEYAVKNIFNISSRGQDLTDLKVDSVAVKTAGNTTLDEALRILIVCGDNYEVYKADGTFVHGSAAAAGVLSATVEADADTEVDIYLFYEGGDTTDGDTVVYTNNLPNLTTASSSILVTFTATADNK